MMHLPRAKARASSFTTRSGEAVFYTAPKAPPYCGEEAPDLRRE